MRAPLLILLSLLSFQSASAHDPREFSFTSPEGLTIFGDRYPAAGNAQGVVALFHQGGGNARAEYGNIIPRLHNWGFDVFAFDLRAGGNRLGGVNRTIEAMGGDDDADYCGAACQHRRVDLQVHRFGVCLDDFRWT